MFRPKISYSASLIAVKAWRLSRKDWATHLKEDSWRFRKAILQLPFPFRILAFLLRSSWIEKLALNINESSIDGEIGHIYVRKAITKMWVEQSNAQNLVVLGGGFDTLLLDSVGKKFNRIIEIDSPFVLARKVKILGKSEQFSSIIFHSDISDPSVWNHLPNDESILIISEGFWEYVPETALKMLFEDIFRRFPNVEIIGTLYNFNEMKKETSANFVKWTSFFGEHLITENGTDHMRSLLAKRNMSLTDEFDSEKISTFFNENRLPFSVWKDFTLARWVTERKISIG